MLMVKVWCHAICCDQIICEAHNELHGYVTSELHAEPKPRVIWEVYTSVGCVSKIAESLGAHWMGL